MEHQSDDQYSQEHYEHENDQTGEPTSYETGEDPQRERQQQAFQPRSLPTAQNQYSNQGYQGQPPTNYPPQAGYVAAYPVQAPPQNYQPQPRPQGYNTPQGASPYNPTNAPVYNNAGYGGQMNQAPAPGYVVQQSPYHMAGYGKNKGTVPWSTGLFDCMEDPTNALLTACCPCFTFGQIAEIVDSGQTTCGTSGILYAVIAAFTLVPCLISCTYRTKLRNKYDLVEIPAEDWLTHCFCEWCSLCQEYRELRNRGLDPALGWQGNMMRNQNMQQQPQVAMMPPPNQTMAGPNMTR